MKVILYMACSLNGKIANKDNKEEFLSDLNWDTLVELAEKTGCIIIGRRTYELVKEWKDFNFDDLKKVLKIVVSAKPKFIVDEKYVKAASPKEAIHKAKTEGFKEVLLVGGSKLNTSFIKDNLINEIIINVEPYLLGRGINLFADEDFKAELSLKSIDKKDDGIIQLRYEVSK